MYFCKVCVKAKNHLEEEMTRPLNSLSCQVCSFSNCYGTWLNIYDHLDYGIAKDLMKSILGKDDSILPDWFWITDFDPDHSKGTHKVPKLYFYYTWFGGCWNERNLCKTTKDNYHTFRNTTFIKAIRLPSPSNINHFHDTEPGRGCENKSLLLSTRKRTEWKWNGT